MTATRSKSKQVVNVQVVKSPVKKKRVCRPSINLITATLEKVQEEVSKAINLLKKENLELTATVKITNSPTPSGVSTRSMVKSTEQKKCKPASDVHPKSLREQRLNRVAPKVSAIGLEIPDSKTTHGNCLTSAILQGYIDIDIQNGAAEQDKIIFKGPCPECKDEIPVTLLQAYNQYDLPKENGPFHCNTDKCEYKSKSGLFVRRLCSGMPILVDGGQFKHCSLCINHGYCLMSLDEVHCKRCQCHYNPVSGRKCLLNKINTQKFHSSRNPQICFTLHNLQFCE